MTEPYRLDITHAELKQLVLDEAIRRDPSIAGRSDLTVNFRYGQPLFEFTASVDNHVETPVEKTTNWFKRLFGL